MASTDKQSIIQSGGNTKWMTIAYVTCIVANLVIFFFMHCYRFGFEDVDMEMTPLPVAVAYIEQARSLDLPVRDFFAKDQRFIDFRREVPNASNFVGGLFAYEYFAYCEPLAAVLYLPFIKIFGISGNTVSAYGCFWTFMCLLGLFIMARHMFGRWYDILSVTILQTSITWLIHAKIGCSQWMPSVFLTLMIVLSLYYYVSRNNRKYLVIAGAMVGLLCAELWIGFFFNGLLLFVTVILSWKIRRSRIIVDILSASAAIILTYLVFIFFYAVFYRIDISDIFLTFYRIATLRFTQGAIPAFNPTLVGKLGYALKCLFIDSTQMDHDNKYLEGVPALSWFFTLAFVFGLAVVLRRRSVSDIVLFVWFAVVFSAMTFLYLFAHRYSLLMLPSMAIIASISIVESGRFIVLKRLKTVMIGFTVLVLAVLLFTTADTYREYYVHYTLRKKASFENDRIRGHAKVCDWIKHKYPGADTLIVLNDYITTAWNIYEFNTFGYPYHYICWNNYVKGTSSPEQVKLWLDNVLGRYRNVVFVFSATMLGDPRTQIYFNDWRPFLAAYPQVKPALTYSYDNRLLLFVYEMSRK